MRDHAPSRPLTVPRYSFKTLLTTSTTSQFLPPGLTVRSAASVALKVAASRSARGPLAGAELVAPTMTLQGRHELVPTRGWALGRDVRLARDTGIPVDVRAEQDLDHVVFAKRLQGRRVVWEGRKVADDADGGRQDEFLQPSRLRRPPTC